MTRLLQALREAGVLLLVATALGFIYTAATEKGLFARPAPTLPANTAGLLAPTMVTRDQAHAYFNSGKALFIDARHDFDYKLGHIRGAINIPLSIYQTKKAVLDTIPKNRLIVAYCDGAECNSSIEVSVKLAKEGYTDVKIFFGGWREWMESNLPIDKSP
ncbi:MAG: rhodanese-like domain-containing protein [Ignavibacteriales bacterium]|nr:rhodanese-like domain-containing protein [Ignavibacteriales bacterium]